MHSQKMFVQLCSSVEVKDNSVSSHVILKRRHGRLLRYTMMIVLMQEAPRRWEQVDNCEQIDRAPHRARLMNALRTHLRQDG